MKREYIIIVDAPASHQPAQDEIFKAVVKLVDTRATEFPKNKGNRGITIIPRRLPDPEIEQLRAEAMGPRRGFPKK